MAPTRVILVVLVLVLAATALSAAPCAPSDGSLCLSTSRFQVSVSWTDFQGNTGAGHAVPLTADTGYFWFFTDSNVELIVKVLDATAINGKFWVFFGALSNVQYDITVRDSATGATKTYHNPSGQFASVGDTSAFSGTAGASVAAHELAVAQGTPSPPSSIEEIQRFINRSTLAPAAFTPCPGPSNTLYASNCRFGVYVTWTDPQGNVGSGQAVQLTADTGYFWFFSDTNIELMIKVLDARPINGKFWVFFGALSNVDYTVHVVDRASGAEQVYHNPQSTFASVGDTGAFRGGFVISVQTNDALAVSGTITAAGGGSLSATAADGTVFTLTVPPNAIASDQDISMTPVSGVSGFPFVGGLSAGVDLEPTGLELLTGGTLTIHTPSSIPLSEETPVAWNGGGTDFFLFPPLPAAGDLQLLITHFAGYGVARGTDAERAAQLPREPLADGDDLEHQISPLLREGRAAASPAGSVSQLKDEPDWKPELKAELDLAYGVYKDDMTSFAGDPDVCVRLVSDVWEWENDVRVDLGPVDQQFPGREEEIQALFESMVKKALETIHSRCQNDVTAINDIPKLFFIAQLRGLQVQLEANDAIHCLSFKLEFTSTISDSDSTPQGVQVIGESVSGNLILTTPEYPSLTKGSGNIVGISGSVQFAVNPGCSFPYTTAAADFNALIEWNNLFRGALTVEMKALYYNVSELASVIHIACHGLPQSNLASSWWWQNYDVVHELAQPVLGYMFMRDAFTMTGFASPWATAHQTGPASLPTFTESTDFKLSYTPQ